MLYERRRAMLLPADRYKSLEHVGSYLSLDDILATSTRVPCRLRMALPGLGPVLAPGRAEIDLVSGTQLEMPLWLATALCASRRPSVRPSLPRQYSAAQQREFEAGACVVNLRRLGPYYYQVGVHLAQITPSVLHPSDNDGLYEADEEESRAKRAKTGTDEEETGVASVAVLLETALRDRLQTVLDGSLHANREQTPTLVARLDELEEALFRAGQERAHELRRWHGRIDVGQLSRSTAAQRLHQQAGSAGSKKRSLALN